MNIANSSPKENIINIFVYFQLGLPLHLNKIAIKKHVQLPFLPQSFYRCDPLAWHIFLWPGMLFISPPLPSIPAIPDVSDEARSLS